MFLCVCPLSVINKYNSVIVVSSEWTFFYIPSQLIEVLGFLAGYGSVLYIPARCFCQSKYIVEAGRAIYNLAIGCFDNLSSEWKNIECDKLKVPIKKVKQREHTSNQHTSEKITNWQN